MVGDFVVLRSNGMPVYNFSVVVDDYFMRISHVIRGEDHLSNTSKHVELFKAFGAPVPTYAHIPLILKQNGPGKMSKRDQGALVEEYQKRGYLPEALVNFLSLLGWNPGDDREKMPIAEIIRLFDLAGVNQSNARFDDKKLAHMNMAYLLEQPADRFVALARNYFEQQQIWSVGRPEDSYFREVMLLSQPKIKGLEELPAYTSYFFTDDYPVDAKAREKIMGKGDPKARLRELAAALSTADFSSDVGLEQWLQALVAKHGLGVGDYIHPGRLAVSGTNVGPSFYGLLRVLGPERATARIDRFLAAN
jgi:glutamyl-tRNA synthetase